MCWCLIGLWSFGQGGHVFQAGYNYSLVRPLDRTPTGTGAAGNLHKTRNFRGLSGGSLGYEWYLPFNDILYFSFGANAVWYRSALEYSVDFYGNPCTGCQLFTAQERIGGPSAYNTFSLQLPVALSIPLNEDFDWFLKVGWDALILLRNQSRWNYLALDWEYQRQNNQWSSRNVGSSFQRSTLEVYTFQQGITLSIWTKTQWEKHTFTLQPSLRLGLRRIYAQPVLGQVNFAFRLGYWLSG